MQIQRSKPNILITGTPGTGKTTLCRLLNQSLIFKYYCIGELVVKQKLYKNFNEQFNVPQFDQDMVVNYLQQKNISEGGFLIEFHSSGFFPKRYFDLIVLLRCDNQILYKRLQNRQYEQKKITQNIECEIMEITKDEVYQSYDAQNIIQLKNQVQDDMNQNLQKIFEYLTEWKIKLNEN